MTPTLLPRISEPRWVEREHDGRRWRQRVSAVAGLSCPSFTPDYRCPGGVIIDASIAPVIAALNDCGHTTMFCCSGLPEDHDSDPFMVAGYLLFADGCEPVGHWVPPEVTVSWDGTHWRFALFTDPEMVRRQWRHLAERLECELAI